MKETKAHIDTSNDFRIMGMLVNRPILTGQTFTPWFSVGMLSLVWFTFAFNIFAGGQALTFTIQQFTDDPRHIAMMTTVGGMLILSPFISYLSDQVWTRFGRRRPFMFIAWSGGAIGMFSFAFIRPISAFLNHGLDLIHLPPVAPALILLFTIVSYQKLLDFAAPLEPLFMETVAPNQRGRFFAIRGVLFTIAMMLFYQVLWPDYDNMLDLSSWLGFPGAVVLKGEQIIYLIAGSLYVITLVFMAFCLKEVKSPKAPNHTLKEMFFGVVKRENLDGTPIQPNKFIQFLQSVKILNIVFYPLIWFLTRTPIGCFITSFCRDVFLSKDIIPFYLILVIPSIEATVWGSFGALMQNDQFQYSKANQALWALPIGLIVMCLAPFNGWYSDTRIKVKWWLRILLLGISATLFFMLYKMYGWYSPENIRHLPSLAIITIMSVMTAIAGYCLIIPILETILDKVGREHARAWIALVTVFKSMIMVILLYVWIRNSPGGVPSITSWMLFMVVSMSLNCLIDAFLAPMIYDYIPRSKMGTVFAGAGFYGKFVTFPMAALGGWWIVWYSTHFGHPAHCKYDYSSLYLLQILCFIPVIAVKVYFLYLILKNKLPKAGVLEVEEQAKREQEELLLKKKKATEEKLVTTT